MLLLLLQLSEVVFLGFFKFCFVIYFLRGIKVVLVKLCERKRIKDVE